MKLAFALLLMSAPLGVGSAVYAAGQGGTLVQNVAVAGLPARNTPDEAFTLIDSDEDEGEGGWLWPRAGDDEDDDEGDDDDDCEEGDDDDGDCVTGAAGNPAKAGNIAPPKNGLFTDGTAPVVKSN